MNKNSDNFVLILLPVVIIIILFITVFNPARRNSSQQINSFEDCAAAGNPVLESYPRQCNTKDGKHFVEQLDQPVQALDTGTPEPFAENWKTYTNPELGLSFPYPTNFEITENQSSENSYYVSIISPLDPNKNPKQTTLSENELKIEIVTEPAVANDNSEKCYYDHTGEPDILAQREIVVSEQKVIQFDWQGLGNGQFTCVIKNNTRYMINKYPLTTTLENVHRVFIDSLTILSQ